MKDKYLQLVQNKNICLIGCGKSAEMCDINFNKYDLVVGVNRLYKNSFFNKHIDILYHNVSIRDNLLHSIDNILNFKPNRFIVLLPSNIWSNQQSRNTLKEILNNYNEKNILYEKHFRDNNKIKYNTDLFTGVLSLMHLLEYNPKSIDMYGMDFYKYGYVDSIPVLNNQDQKHIFNPYLHNIEINLTVFNSLINNKHYLNNIQA